MSTSVSQYLACNPNLTSLRCRQCLQTHLSMQPVFHSTFHGIPTLEYAEWHDVARPGESANYGNDHDWKVPMCVCSESSLQSFIIPTKVLQEVSE